MATMTIPSTDTAFRELVDHVVRTTQPRAPAALEARLRKTLPRAVVRQREISGPPVWYVYRDGAWRSPAEGSWWEAPNLPRMVVSADGWVVEANATMRGLLEIDESELGARHFTDFIVPGTIAESTALFEIIGRGHTLTATVLIRPTSGQIIAVDMHATREGDRFVGVIRLADDVEAPASASAMPAPHVETIPQTDAAFRGYVDAAISRMPEPTIDGLALRLRRLYPHADVVPVDGHWRATREPASESGVADWWLAPDLPRVRYDAQALILEANDAAVELLGQPLVGHFWQEFVTPGSTEQVSRMLEILAAVGRAESRFRMPGAGGELVEFDSYTEVMDESYTTVMRPRPSGG
jgi:PAS domain-containing protein